MYGSHSGAGSDPDSMGHTIHYMPIGAVVVLKVVVDEHMFISH